MHTKSETDLARSDRRDALRRLSCAAGVTLLGPSLIACASRGSPAQPQAVVAIRKLAVLPVGNESSPHVSDGEGYDGRHLEPIVDAVADSAKPGVIVGVGLLAALVVGTAAYAKAHKQRELDQIMMNVEFDPVSFLDRRVTDLVTARNPSYPAALDGQTANDVRRNVLAGLPEGTDAFLDISVLESGFNDSTRAGGFAPMLHVRMTLRPMDINAPDIESFDYYGDFRASRKDPRWFQSPETLTFKDLAAMRRGAPGMRARLEAWAERFAQVMATDILAWLDKYGVKSDAVKVGALAPP